MRASVVLTHNDTSHAGLSLRRGRCRAHGRLPMLIGLVDCSMPFSGPQEPSLCQHEADSSLVVAPEGLLELPAQSPTFHRGWRWNMIEGEGRDGTAARGYGPLLEETEYRIAQNSPNRVSAGELTSDHPELINQPP